MKKSKSRAVAHEKAIKISKINILALTDQERKLEKQLKQLKYKSVELTIVLQKIASQPIFNSFLSPNKTLSTARSINLINFLRDELATAKVRLNTKLAESNVLKSKINLEQIRFEKTARGLTLLNKKLTSLITKHNFISDQQSLNHVADEVRLENLSSDLQSLLLKLKNGNQEKDSFIKELEQLSENTMYKQPFSHSSKPKTTPIIESTVRKGYQNKKFDGKKVGFLSPKSFLKNKSLLVELFDKNFTWLDSGTHESMLEASNYIHTIEKRKGRKVACIEEIAFLLGYINRNELLELALPLKNNQYGKYLIEKVLI